MPYSLGVEIVEPQSVEDFIEELLEDLRVIDEYFNYSLTIPTAFRVRFAPASSLVHVNNLGTRTFPIDLSTEF